MISYVYQFVFLHVTVNFFFIAYLLYRSKNGRLRHLMIAFFIALGYASGMRLITPYLLLFATQDVVNLFVGVPVSITGSLVCHHLFRTYLKG